MKRALIIGALVSLSSCMFTSSVGPPTCTVAPKAVSGTLSQDLLGTWEDAQARGDLLEFSAPDRVESRIAGVQRAGTWNLSGKNFRIDWDDGQSSSTMPIFVTDDKLAIEGTFNCLGSPPPPICSAYRRVDCNDELRNAN